MIGFGLVIADAVFIHKCARIEEGTWEWWLVGCWMWPTAADVLGAVTIGAMVGVLAFSLRQRRQA